MSHGTENSDKKSFNIARYFIEEQHIAWVALVVVMAWGIYGVLSMPQRKDPDVPARTAMVIVPWQGINAEQIEQLVTKKIEGALSQNQWVEEIRSVARNSVTTVQFDLSEKGHYDTDKELDDIKIKLDSVVDLPKGAGPIEFVKDFGDTTALMLTVASPPEEVDFVREKSQVIEATLRKVRRMATGKRLSVVAVYPLTASSFEVDKISELVGNKLQVNQIVSDVVPIHGAGFTGFDVKTDCDAGALKAHVEKILQSEFHEEEFDPDSWQTAVIGELDSTFDCLKQVAGDKYTYRDLDDFTHILQRSLKTLPIVSKVERFGVLPENVLLNFSSTKLADYGIKPSDIPDIVSGRNLNASELGFNSNGQNLLVQLSGQFKNELQSENLIVKRAGQSQTYLRDFIKISRSYESPPTYLNHFSRKDDSGRWISTKAVTLSIQMRKGQHIDEFGRLVDQNIALAKKSLPSDLVLARTSDQPLQTKDSIDLFVNSLIEALVLVVIVSWIGFWSWRTALLIAAAIPMTFALTFGIISSFGIDLQQISIASLIIALGLLVDVPVVSSDAIKRELSTGISKKEAAWLGPTKLFRTMIFATLTNIISYLPLLLLSGDTGKFLYSLPVVISVSLLAALFVSVTFVPLVGALLLKAGREASIEELRTTGLTSVYYRVASKAIAHRKLSFLLSLVILVPGLALFGLLKTEFFPKDLQYFSYIDVWMPNDAPLLATQQTVRKVESIVENIADHSPGLSEKKEDHAPLQSITSFVGGGGPRFWSTATPEDRQTNYAQVILRTTDKHATSHLLEASQRQFDTLIPTAIIDTRTLETGKPIGIPVQMRISGEDIPRLRIEADKLKAILRKCPIAKRTRDDWGESVIKASITVDTDKAVLSDISNRDIEDSLKAALTGINSGTLRQGDKQIPLIAKVSIDERSHLSDLENLYVFSSADKTRVPLSQLTKTRLEPELAKLRRFNQYRTITIQCWPAQGHLPSEIIENIKPDLDPFVKQLPSDFIFRFAGEHKEQTAGFSDLVIVLAICVMAIYLALLFQFKHIVKPLIVFAAIPYGIVGAVCALLLTGQPFGFMAFLGVVSLIGVIVSHIIVLFEFIEELRAEGEPLEQALVNAALLRLRPVLITVSATVIALFPLAAHGGPLWEALCFAQIGGLCIATFVTLGLVPILYAIVVKDLKWIKWEAS